MEKLPAPPRSFRLCNPLPPTALKMRIAGYFRSSLDFRWTKLVSEAISTVALAEQLSREFTVSDRGIDMEQAPKVRSPRNES